MGVGIIFRMVSTLPLSGVNSRFFSTIPLSRFSLKMSRFFLGISSWEKYTLCALLSVKWNSDDSATTFQCSAKLIRSAKLKNGVCFGLFVPRRARVKDILGYRSSGKIGVASRPTTCNTRPAGRVRPATRVCPAREIVLNYNGNRPAACHRPSLHHVSGLSCLPLHRLKTNCFDNALSKDCG